MAVHDGVGVERGGEPALVGAQVAQQEVGGLLGDPPASGSPVARQRWAYTRSSWALS